MTRAFLKDLKDYLKQHSRVVFLYIAFSCIFILFFVLYQILGSTGRHFAQCSLRISGICGVDSRFQEVSLSKSQTAWKASHTKGVFLWTVCPLQREF